MFTVERRIWKHAPAQHDTDYQGQWRWLLLDDGLCYDHFATEAEATDEMARLNEEIDPITDLPYD